MTEYGPAIELFDELGPERAEALGVYEMPIGGPGTGGYGIAFGGDVEQLNAALAALGINVVVRKSLYEDADDWDEDELADAAEDAA